MKLTPHFTFDGQSEEALKFYSVALNGEIIRPNPFFGYGKQLLQLGKLKPEDQNANIEWLSAIR